MKDYRDRYDPNTTAARQAQRIQELEALAESRRLSIESLKGVERAQRGHIAELEAELAEARADEGIQRIRAACAEAERDRLRDAILLIPCPVPEIGTPPDERVRKILDERDRLRELARAVVEAERRYRTAVEMNATASSEDKRALRLAFDALAAEVEEGAR